MKGTRIGFEHLVFEIFKDEKEYNKTRHQLLRGYDIMTAKVKTFKNMTLAIQFDIVNTACLMAMGASLRQLRTIEVLTRNKPVRDIERDYCPEFGYKEPELLNICEIKQFPAAKNNTPILT